MDVDDPDVLARIEEACDAIDDRRGLLLGAPQADPERLQAARDLVITRLVEVVLVNASDDTTGCLRTVNEL
ncbi:hypothetical protein C7419_104142 [Cupriavidus plantarum]|uniref:Uncharacterized protein n=2 Tax=Cupriavidus plantarum TaxID=942865 RepID=A0A316EQ51_9BURK|nr:hypothetical protein C7419_104142 [Cupriavidus plantarum]